MAVGIRACARSRAIAVARIGLAGALLLGGRSTVAHRAAPACPAGAARLAPMLVACEQRARAARVSTAPVIDGRLDDDAWPAAQPLDGFRQREPDPGAAASERTEVRIVHDDRALYLAWRLDDREPARIRAVAGRRDVVPESDQVTLFLDPYHDHRTGYVFVVSAAGVLADGTLYGESEVDWNWDGVWQAVARPDGQGWVVEMAIPWSTLRWRGDGEWGIHLRRYLSRRGETSEHAVVSIADGRLASRFEHLAGLDELRPGLGLQLAPFVALRLQPRFAEDVPLRHDRVIDRVAPRAGVDVRARLGASLTLDATVLPDFGQVEADPTIVNLDPYEVFLPEKRPFFYQGQELFRTPFTLLHTRRVGAPPAWPALAAGESLAWVDTEAPVWAAAKLTGRVGRGGVGVFTALAGGTEASVVAPSGESRVVRASPLTEYSALRLLRNLAGGGAVGLLATGVTRIDGPDAYVGGLDLDLRSASRHTLAAQAVGSATNIGGDGGARGGWAAGAGGGRTIGEPWRWYLEGWAFSRDVDWNDAGYLRRGDRWGAGGWLERARTRTAGRLLRTSLTLGTSHEWTFAAQPLAVAHVAWLTGSVRWRTLWELSLEVGAHAPRVDDREMRGGTPLRRPWRGYAITQLSSNPSRLVAGSLAATVAADRESASVDTRGRLLLGTRRVAAELSVAGLVNRRRPRWAETRSGPAGDAYILAALDQDQLETTLNLTAQLAPRVTVQGFVQWLHEVERRDDWRVLAADGSATPTTPGVARRALASLNAQVVLRWEYRPGSALHVVYRHRGAARSEDGDGAGELRPASAVRAAFSAPADDLFLLKLSYLWGR